MTKFHIEVETDGVQCEPLCPLRFRKVLHGKPYCVLDSNKPLCFSQTMACWLVCESCHKRVQAVKEAEARQAGPQAGASPNITNKPE